MGERSGKVLCFIGALVVAITLSALSDRYLRLSEAVTYFLFGVTVILFYEALKLITFRER